jgi:glutamine synthetase
MTPSEITALIEDQGIKLIDFKFSGLLGDWHHFTAILKEFNEDIFTEGLSVDGSPIRGWQFAEAGKYIAVPDPKTAWIDTFSEERTLSLICSIQDSITREPLGGDPRGIAQKAEFFLKNSGIADTASFSPSTQFFIFDDARFEYRTNSSFHNVDSVEGIWNGAREEFPNLGNKIRLTEGFSPVSPADTLQDIRSEICLELEKAGIRIERHSRGPATAGHAQIDIGFASLLAQGDQMQCFKYIAKNSAKQHNKIVTFMPKPLFGDHGSRMPTRVALWKEDRNVFEGDKFAGLSDLGLFFLGGILKHLHALAAFACPATNSYSRFHADSEGPFTLTYSAGNRSAAICVSAGSLKSKAKSIEIRTPDSAATSYAAFSAILMAGLDGVQNEVNPGQPLETNSVVQVTNGHALPLAVPDSLSEALDALAADHEFLLKGNVFTTEFVSSWIRQKRSECEALKIRPHPYEFALYFDR